ncbi:MAG: hypothetical protein K2X52_02520 [Mycobacteriaceae bacterium]|nr:hypothetical protein [Mycobacteriaceae bacterium]
MGQLIMLGTLFGLIIVIFGAVIYFDPDARRPRDDERSRGGQTVDEADR